MRVLVLSSEFPPGPGGIGTHAHHVALQLYAHGWEVHVAAPQDLAKDDEIAGFNASLPFEVHRLHRFSVGPVMIAHRVAAIVAHIRRLRPDVVLASGERMVWLAGVLCPVLRVPHVAVGHAMEFNREPRWEYLLARRGFESARGVICVSKYTWSRMEKCGMKPRDGAVIPNGADPTRFHPVPVGEAQAFRRAHGLEDAAMLITVGSVHERKGQDLVIRALPRIRERVPNVHYVAAGMPYRRDAFMAIATELRVADRVHFVGALDNAELLRAINAADLFVLASQHTAEGDFEGFGIAALEAALCGRAAVVSDNSGLVEAISPGETGLLATLGDPVSTADRIIELLTDRERLARMGERARTWALSTGTWAERGTQYDRELRRFVAG